MIEEVNRNAASPFQSMLQFHQYIQKEKKSFSTRAASNKCDKARARLNTYIRKWQPLALAVHAISISPHLSLREEEIERVTETPKKSSKKGIP
jgi:hypothetical protein